MKDAIPEFFKQYARTASFVLLAWASIAPVGSIMARPRQVQDQPFITVCIYNYAHLDGLEIHAGEKQAAGIFASVGVRIAWTDYSQEPRISPVQPQASDADFFIRILPASMAKRGNYTADALGEAITGARVGGTSPGRIANVFYDRVEHISFLWGLDPGQILGDAMAHELGHLLLGSQHSSQGIMKAPWTHQELELAGRGNLRFRPIETTAIQRAVRSLPGNSSITVSALH